MVWRTVRSLSFFLSKDLPPVDVVQKRRYRKSKAIVIDCSSDSTHEVDFVLLISVPTASDDIE